MGMVAEERGPDQARRASTSLPQSGASQPLRILVFSASLRADSLNTRLAALAATTGRPAADDEDVAGARGRVLVGAWHRDSWVSEGTCLTIQPPQVTAPSLDPGDRTHQAPVGRTFTLFR